MTIGQRPICLGCRFFDATAEVLRCDAFPDRIPDAIIRNELDHRKSVRGDQGIQFQAKSAADARYAREVFGRG